MISARNQIKGGISEIKAGAINGIVKLDVAEGVRITSTISLKAIDSLGLAEGKQATAISGSPLS